MCTFTFLFVVRERASLILVRSLNYLLIGCISGHAYVWFAHNTHHRSADLFTAFDLICIIVVDWSHSWEKDTHHASMKHLDNIVISYKNDEVAFQVVSSSLPQRYQRPQISLHVHLSTKLVVACKHDWWRTNIYAESSDLLTPRAMQI
jgi:hypothetical protein